MGQGLATARCWAWRWYVFFFEGLIVEQDEASPKMLHVHVCPLIWIVRVSSRSSSHHGQS